MSGDQVDASARGERYDELDRTIRRLGVNGRKGGNDRNCEEVAPGKACGRLHGSLSMFDGAGRNCWRVPAPMLGTWVISAAADAADAPPNPSRNSAGVAGGDVHVTGTVVHCLAGVGAVRARARSAAHSLAADHGGGRLPLFHPLRHIAHPVDVVVPWTAGAMTHTGDHVQLHERIDLCFAAEECVHVVLVFDGA